MNQPRVARVELDTERINRQFQDPGPGKHMWVVTAVFAVSDQTMRTIAHGHSDVKIQFDHENCKLVQGPGCFKCERLFTPEELNTRCGGSIYE